MQKLSWQEIIKGLVHLVRHKMELLNAISTRLSDVASTIRATLYKQGERNLLRNIQDGNGYEGVIEVWYGTNDSDIEKYGEFG